MNRFSTPAVLFLTWLSVCLAVPASASSAAFLDVIPDELAFSPSMLPFIEPDCGAGLALSGFNNSPNILPLLSGFPVIEDISYALEDHSGTDMSGVFVPNMALAFRGLFDGELRQNFNVELDRLDRDARLHPHIERKVALPGEERDINAEVSMRDQIPEGIGKIGFDLPLESKLEISGRKGVSVNYGNVIRTNPPAGQNNIPGAAPGITNGFTLTQDLQVRLTGTIGKRVIVNVDYDDTKIQQRDISLVYKGEAEEFIQKAEFGDVTLSLPNTQFTGYNKNIFGGDAEMKLGPINLKVIGAQTKGTTDIDKFTGGYTPVKLDILDVNFIRYKYYQIMSGTTRVTNIDPGSVQLWMDDQNGSNNNYPPGWPSNRGADPTLYTQYSSSNTFSLDYLHPGIDYVIDYVSGIITVNKSVQSNYILAVAYSIGGVKAGYDISGQFDFTEAGTPPHLINSIQPLMADPKYYDEQVMNFYSLGNKKILLPQYDAEFVFKIYDNNNAEQPLSNYGYAIDVDNGLVRIQSGIVANPDRPFSYVSPPDAYPTFANPTTLSRYRIHIEYKYKINSYQLKHMNIVKGSEIITVGGVRFSRDSQYSIDYDSGFISFFNLDDITNKEVVVTYEYSPFGGSGQSNIFGARAELNLTSFSLGSTYLFSGSQSPLEVPSIGATPTSLNVFDIDSKITLTQDMIRGALGDSWILPTDISFSGEIAKSMFNPNTFTAKNGEKGPAMIDSMEGTDNISGFPTLYTSWFASSVPVEDAALKNDSANPALNNRSRLLLSNFNGSGHDETSNASKQLLRLDYDFSSGLWGGIRYPISASGADYSNYRYMEVWMLADWSQAVSVNVDLGITSEDSTGNSALETEDVNRNGVLDNGEDIGIPIRYASNVINEGVSNNLLDTEDMDANGSLDTNESYFYYNFDLNNANAGSWVANTVTNSAGTWKLLKIPLSFDDTGTGKVTGSSVPSKTLIKHVRLWLKNKTGASPAGSVVVESMQLTGNKWQLKNISSAFIFNVKTISKDTDSSYIPLTSNFYTLNTAADATREQSLALAYTGSTTYSNYAVKFYSQAVSFMDYATLRFDIYKVNAFPGDIVFIRLGSDETNYYQYNFQLDSAGQGWQTMSAALSSPAVRNGTFYINNVKQISIGVLSPTGGGGGIVWVNNLRVADPLATEGIAERLGGSVKFGDTLAVTLDYKNMQSRFTLFENASTNTAISLAQSNQSVKQSIRSTLASGTLKPLASIPINITYRKDELLTDDSDKNNPNYLSFPERQTEAYSGSVGLSFLAPFIVSVNGSYMEDISKYLPGAQSLNVDNTQSKAYQLTSHASYSLPADIFGIPLGKNDLAADFNYGENKISHDLLTANNTYTITRETLYRWSGGYEILPGIPLSPMYSYRTQEKRGNVYVSNTSINISNPYVSDFTPQTSSKSAGLSAAFTRMPGFTPRVNYSGQVDRDFNVNQLRTNNVIEIASEFRLSEWFSELAPLSPSLNVSHRIGSNALYDQYSGGASSPLATLQLMDEWGLLPLEKLALNSSQVISDNINGRVKLGALSFNPRGSLSSERNLQSQFLTRTGIYSLGTGLVMENPPIPLLDFLKPVSLNVDYDFKNIQRFDSNNLKISDDYLHTGNITSPFRISDDFNGSITFSTSIEDRLENNILYQNRSYTPGIEINQNLVFSDPIHLPDFWPFNGAIIRIDQALRMNYRLNVALTRNLISGSTLNSQINTDSYNAGTTLQYKFSKNIQADMGVVLTYFTDNMASVNNYIGYGVNLKVSAVF